MITVAESQFGTRPSRPTPTRADSSDPSGFVTAVIATATPGLTSALSPGPNIAIDAVGGTTIFFSPSLYFNSKVWPSAPPTRLRDIGVGHRAVRRLIPRAEPFAQAARAFGKDVDRDRLLAAVGLRHTTDADEGADLDVAELRLGVGDHRPVLGQADLHARAVARLHHQHIAIEAFDGAADAAVLRRLRDRLRDTSSTSDTASNGSDRNDKVIGNSCPEATSYGSSTPGTGWNSIPKAMRLTRLRRVAAAIEIGA